MNKNQKYFTTGEFAKICKVNKQTLIYYDQIGLFSPMMKDEKGYRFYSIAQYDLFSVIELLQTMGMSLKSIQEYMAMKTPENFLILMEQQRGIVARKRKELELLEESIKAKIFTTKEALKTDFSKVTVEHLPTAILYLSENIENATEEQFVQAVSDFIDELDRFQLDTGYPIGGVMTREQLLARNYTNYKYLYMEQPQPRSDHPYFKAIEGEVVVGYHIGSPKTIGETYEKLFTVIQENDYKIGDYIYEEYLYDAVMIEHEEDYVLKIMIEIEK